MPQRPTTLGLLGPVVSPDCPATVRVTRFDHLQRLAGELAQSGSEPWWVGHAACHALMNGVDAVMLSVVDGGHPLEPSRADRAAWVGALERLLEAPVDLVVAPGLTDLETLEALATRLSDHGPDAPALLFDTARGAPPGAVVFALDHLTRAAPRARLLTAIPWVSTHSPGRPGAEPLPPSCLAPALVLGATATLTGLHEAAPVQASPTERDALRRAGALELVHTGARRQLTLRERPALAAPEPIPDPRRAHLEPSDTDPRHTAVEARLQADLDHALEALAAESFDGRKSRTQQDLWSRARRTATVVLRGYKQRGEIVDFSVRCDAETNQGAHPLRPVVAISVQPRARSVAELVVRMGGDE